MEQPSYHPGTVSSAHICLISGRVHTHMMLHDPNFHFALLWLEVKSVQGFTSSVQGGTSSATGAVCFASDLTTIYCGECDHIASTDATLIKMITLPRLRTAVTHAAVVWSIRDCGLQPHMPRLRTPAQTRNADCADASTRYVCQVFSCVSLLLPRLS